MAEFKLGRIRFVYQGEWVTGRNYVVDDVVSIGGKSWICVISHTSSGQFATDQTFNPTKWNLLADGTSWKGDWAPTTYYDIGNMVKYGGNVYVCNEAHTSATYANPTYLGLEDDLGLWDVFATSFDWKGDWAYSTRYKENDTVVYGGTTYICNTHHISTANTSTLSVTGLTNTGTNVTLTFTAQTLPPFVIGSTVNISGIDPAGYNNSSATVVACTTTSVTYANTTIDSYSSGGTITGTTHFGLEKDQSKWDYFNQGVTFLGDWTDFERYRINDVVKYGASTWICTTAHDSKATFEDSKWSIFTEGLQFESSWNSATTYQVGDTVTYGGYSYIAKQNHSNQNPSTATSYWDVYTTGFNFKSDWDSTTSYKVGDVVRLGGYTYLAQADNSNQVPPNLTYWAKINSGTKFRDTVASYVGISGTVQGSSAGINATFDITRSGTIYTVIVNNGGSGFAVGDSIKILGTSIGGLSPVNDLVVTVNSEVSGAIDSVTITGFSSTWAHPVEYVEGDLVFFGASTYICIQGHTSGSLNRPDADTSAQYWNLFSAGSEASILTTEGDTYYFGAQGPTRLPIGQDGQMLRVKGGYPTWAYYGVINNLVYVAPTGTDSSEAGWGLTVDKPWKSVRFAADQINNGYLNTNAKTLLEKNKLFMMREVTNWITYTYSVSITASVASSDRFTCNDTTNLVANMPIEFSGTTGGVTAGTKYFVKQVIDSTHFTISDTQGGALKQLTDSVVAMTGTLSYDHAFCERDTGYLVDAVIHDISHGGNLKSTSAAKAYYTKAGSAYINSNFGQQITQTVAAYNYLKELMVRVLANDAPDVNYQYQNGVADMVEQIADNSVTAEAGTSALAQALLTIVTDGITAGTATAIPAAVTPNTTISVKTGTYYEVLPITIPNYTAIVGDELRGTVINPQPAIANLVNDKSKTISALNRIKAVVSDLVQNNDVTVTSGNTEQQQYLGGYKGNATVSTAVSAKTADMVTVLNGGLGAVPAFTIADPSNYDTGYFNARRLIVANKAFIISEVSAWIDAQILAGSAPFAGFVYGGAKKTACERDVGYIVDALRYDLTYGGNLETSVAARSYYSFGVLVETGEKLQALAVQARLKDIIDNIATGDTAGWTKTTSSVQDVSGTAGSSAAAVFAQARIQEIYDTINTGISPEVIAPNASWVSADLINAFNAIQAKKSRIQTGVIGYINLTYPTLVYDTAVCSRDVGYIVDAISYDVMFDSNFRSVKAAMSYYRATASAQLVVASQLPATLDTIAFIEDSIKQVTDGTTGSVGSLVAVARTTTAVDALYNVLNNGIDSAPTELITDPAGLDVGYLNARTQIANNYAFIKADVSKYLENDVTYGPIWTALGPTGQAACQRDVGYILDAIRYDLTYGGNTQSLIVGSSYYSYINLVIQSNELTATLAAYTHLKNIIDEVAQRLTSGPTAGNTTPQVVTGTGGSLAAAQFAQARVQDVIDWITNGSAPTAIAPTTAGVDADLLAGWTELQKRKAEIVLDGTGYVHKFYQGLSFNEETCSRDIGYMVDAIGYDVMFNSNFASVIAAKSYYRALTSTQLVLAEQKAASLGLVNFLKYKIKSILANGGAVKVHSAIEDIVGTINGGVTPKFLWPSFTGIDAENYAGAKLIWENKEFIKAEVIAYIDEQIGLGTTGFVGLEYSQDACSRDVGYIVDALRYDLTYGGNSATRQAALAYYSQLTDALQIDTADKTATIAAYNAMKTLIQAIAQDGAYSALQGSVARITGTAGDATTASTVGSLLTAMINYITDKTANPITETLAGTSWVDPNLVTQYNLLQSNRTTVRNSIITWIGENYPNLVYDTVTCSRDVGLIIDAIGYDLMFGSNFRTVKAAMSYYQAQASVVIASQKRATVQAMRYLKELLSDLLINYTPGHTSAWNNMETLINVLDKGIGDTPLVVGSSAYINDSGVVAAAEILKANKAFLENESTAWIRSQFGGVVSSTSGNTLTTVASHNLSVGDPVEFRNDITSTYITAVSSTGNKITLRNVDTVQPGMTLTLGGGSIGNLTVSGSYFVLTVDTVNNQVTVSSTYNGSAFDPGTATSPLVAVTIGSIWGGVQSGVQYYVATVPTTKTFTIVEEIGAVTPVSLTTTSGYMKVSYSFNETACRRDMGAYVDALVYDLQYPGNYKSTLAALLYNNAVAGSERSDMFWVSNSSGLRNCTLRGLLGDLTDANIYGTKRPTAGAFVALNPGYGPRDSSVWVHTRSHYSQNVTMFGTGCTGAKIDSALHAGGNKSMVKNDFTTIISDGIGVWCTGSDSLTELVSVFNYYGYAGYIAELGGRIRATNGNSSYGTYGVIAEGVSSKETPLYGNLDNRAAQAQVTETVTDALAKVLRMEFGNAGTGYTNVEYTINGSGYNAAATGDEFRDGSVFETRIIDLNNNKDVGGSNYETASNAAQLNTAPGEIIIAATDQALSAAYVGMRIQITAGTGVGQYANILTYETGSKRAQIVKDSFVNLTVTGTTASTDVLTVANTATLYVDMPIYLSADIGGATANTLYYVKSIVNGTTFTISTDTTANSGATFDILSNTSAQTVTLYAAGWDHVVPGSTIQDIINLTSGYIIEPRINYTAPGYKATARTLNNTAAWKAISYGDSAYVAVAGSGTTANYSANGTTWATAGALASSSTWVDVAYGGGYGAKATAVVGGLGGRGAVLQAVFGVPNTTGAATADQIASVTIVNGGQGYTTPPVIVFTPTNGGSGAVATCQVLDGVIVNVTVTIPGSGYNSLPTVTAATDRVTHIIVDTWGSDYYSSPQVTLVGGGYSTQATVKAFGSGATDSKLQNAGVKTLIIDNQGAGYTSTPTVQIVDTSARYVAIASGGTGPNCYTTRSALTAGTAWTAGTDTGKANLAAITYGNGAWVAVGGTNQVVTSTTGALWTSRTIPTLGAGSYSAIAYGNKTFVAISTGNNATAIASNGNNGSAWVAGGSLPSSTTWTSVAYGNGRFVAIASGGTKAAYSIDKGVTWAASPAGLPSSQTWTHISYGQGLFFAVASGTSVAATSPDGINWTEVAMPSSSDWNAIEFGNIDSKPLWVAASNTSGQIAASIKTGARALGRVKVNTGAITEVRMIEPGSGYPTGSVSATTVTTNLITVDNTDNLVALQPVEFFGASSGGLEEETTYYVVTGSITSTQFKVATTVANASAGTAVTLTTTSPSGMTYRAGPVVTVTDPNNVDDAGLRVRLGDGALGNPSFTDRGADNTTATTDVSGDGYSDLFQVSTFVNVYGLSEAPTPGANVEFASIPGVYYKLVTVTNVLESTDYPGTFTATFQINPGMSTLLAPRHGDRITTRLKYSQVRLTGHDFLYIGTGGYEKTNYPYVDITKASQSAQTQFSAGGRVFFTSTDQDGNFNVGNLFGVQQATGTATLNASAFNLSGLNSLQLGSVELGIGSAVITQFSTDPFFTADSDSIVPTQRAIRAYITAQIGGGQSSLNVNTLTSGVVYIAGNTITTTTGAALNITSKMNFTGGIVGAPVALGFFLTR